MSVIKDRIPPTHPISKDSRLNHQMVTTATKIPRWESLSAVGDEPGMEGNIIIDRSTASFCYHNGSEWVCFDANTALGQNQEQVALFYAPFPDGPPTFVVNLEGANLLGVQPFGYTTLDAPSTTAVKSAQSTSTTLDWTGEDGDLALTNTSSNTIIAMIETVLTYTSSSNTGDIGPELKPHNWLYTINNLVLGQPPESATDARYFETLVNTYLFYDHINPPSYIYSANVTMQSLLELAPGDTVRVAGAISNGLGPLPIIIQTFQMSGTVVSIQ